jgi:preprotein translocase subunit YajC
MGGWDSWLWLAIAGVALYFIMIRPQQKRAKEQQAKIKALEPGARVMTVSGIIGTVKYLGEKQAILELAPGVEITVVKQAISTQPVEDEFEYSDGDDDVEADADLPAVAASEPDFVEPEFVEPTSDEPAFDQPGFDEPAAEASRDDEPPAEAAKN